MLSIIAFVVSVIVLIGADQLIKYFVETNMAVGETIPCISWLVQWTRVENRGASFGIFQGMTWFFVAVTLLMTGLLVFICAKRYIKHPLGVCSVALLVSGGIGNLIDRVFKDGAVTDYIDITPLFEFPVFNLADCCITVGTVLLCVYILFMHDKLTENEKKEQTEDEA